MPAYRTYSAAAREVHARVALHSSQQLVYTPPETAFLGYDCVSALSHADDHHAFLGMHSRRILKQQDTQGQTCIAGMFQMTVLMLITLMDAVF